MIQGGSQKGFSKNPHHKRQILWVQKQPPALQLKIESDPFFSGWEIRFSGSLPVDFRDLAPQLILVEASLDSELNETRRLRELFPNSIRILIQDLPGLSVLKRAVNRAGVFSIIESSADERQWIELLREAVIESQYVESRLRLLRESSQQNKELEKLNVSLENLVEDRTKHIQISKEMEEEKVLRMRHLIRFLQELSLRSSFEEVLNLMRQDLRSFHQVHDPVLLYEIDARGPQVVFWRQSEVITKPWTQSKSLDFISSIHLQDFDMSKKLANEFGRPFGKALVLPLEVPGTESDPQSTFQLVLENSLPEEAISPVLDYLLERMQPLGTALARIRVEMDLTHFSFRWEKTFDGLRDPIAIIDHQDRVLRSNKKFSEKILRGVCYQDFAELKQRCEGCPVPQVFKTGQVQKGQVRRNGRVFEVHSYPVSLVKDGKVTNVVNQYIDQTRAREIYMRLLQSEKMGALGLLAGNIAHELNNPLTGLRSLAQVLIQEAQTSEQLKNDLVEIEKATERCQLIIRNLLDFVQQDTQNLQSVCVDDLIEKTLPFLKASMRTLRMTKNLQLPQIRVKAEPHLLQQVIFNLINNACQAMEQKGTLSLETEKRGNSLRLWVIDDGPGIPLEIQSRIFEPFFTTKKEGSGTGLGLSLSKEIVESFGGQIGVESNTPRGAKFWIELPILEEV